MAGGTRQTRVRSRPAARQDDARDDKRRAILDAALVEFREKGFAAARLEDVAERAGVAKGTVYLYVESKLALLQALLKTDIAGPIELLEAQIRASDAPTSELLRRLFGFLVSEVLGTDRREIAKLVLSEATRFPDIAEFHHREVVSRGLSLLRFIAARAIERGESRAEELVRFPHLMIAPGLVALIWKSLFEPFEPLDADGLIEAHLALLERVMASEPQP